MHGKERNSQFFYYFCTSKTTFKTDKIIIMRIISIAIAFFVSMVTNAQVNTKEGFIITNQKDTIYGMIDYRTNTVNAQQCLFKAKDAADYVKYTPGQIAAYRFKESGKFYVSKKFDNEEEFFAEFLVDGIMNLYRKEKGFRQIYYLENEEGEVVSYENMEQDINYDQRTANMRAQVLYRQVAKSQRAVSDIKAGNMSDNQLIKMVRDYHEDVCTSNEECIKYEYDDSKENTKCYLSVFAGGGYGSCSDSEIWYGIRRSNTFTVGASLDIDGGRFAKGMLFQLIGSYSGVRSKNEYTLGIWELNTGVMFGFPINDKFKFTARGGLAFSACFVDGGIDGGLAKGLYGGCGLELPVQKHAVLFNVDYRCIGWGKINVVQATIGYRF